MRRPSPGGGGAEEKYTRGYTHDVSNEETTPPNAAGPRRFGHGAKALLLTAVGLPLLGVSYGFRPVAGEGSWLFFAGIACTVAGAVYAIAGLLSRSNRCEDQTCASSPWRPLAPWWRWSGS